MGLSVKFQAFILEQSDRLRKEKNIGALLATRALSLIARLADEVLVMQDGRGIESDLVADIVARHGTAYTPVMKFQ